MNKNIIIIILMAFVLCGVSNALDFPILSIYDGQLTFDKVWFINESQGYMKDDSGYLTLNATNRMPLSCTNTQVAKYDTATKVWICANDQAAAGGTAVWYTGLSTIRLNQTLTSNIDVINTSNVQIRSVPIADIFVNLSGDTMTGDLSTSGWFNGSFNGTDQVLKTTSSVTFNNVTGTNGFFGALTGTASIATLWASVSSLQSKWFYDSSDVLTFNETQLNDSIEEYGYSTTTGTVISVATDDSYLTGGAITTTGTITFNESVLNETIEGYGYSTTTGTVTSVATDDTYLTGGAITATGTVTFNTSLAGSSLAVNSSDYWDNLGDPTDITALGTVGSATSITSSAFVGPLTGTASIATLWASVSSLQARWLFDNSNVLTFNETRMNATIDDRDSDTTYTAGEGLVLTSTTFSANMTFMNDTMDARDTDTTYTASGTLLDLTGTAFSINEGTLTDETICEYEATGTQIECTKTLDASGQCTGDICGGGHTHPASEVTAGTFAAGAYVMQSNLTVERVRLEVDSVNHHIYDNATCVLITGDTSTLAIC